MTRLIRTALLLALTAAGCDDATEPGTPDLATCCADLGAAARDLSTPPPAHDLAGADGGGSECAHSPSGYACDPWGAHLLMLEGGKRAGTKLRLTLWHNPDYEGGQEDTQVPPEHDFYQTLTVDLELTPAVRAYACVVLAPTATPASFDASAAGFLDAVDHSFEFTLLRADHDTFDVHLDSLIDVCGGATLPTVAWPPLATAGRPALPDLALLVPLSPSPRNFTVGTTFHGWLSRGIFGVDEESELTPPVEATVVSLQ